MRKINQTKKLNLNTQTIRELSTSELPQLVGGQANSIATELCTQGLGCSAKPTHCAC